MDNQEQPAVTSNYKFFKTLAIGFTIASFGIVIGVAGYILGTRSNQSLQDRVDKQNPVIFPSPGESGNKPLPSTLPETANWKTFTNTEGNYGLKYPQNWYFKTYDQVTQKGHAIYQNEPFEKNLDPVATRTGFVNGEINIMTANQIRGSDWANISEKEFYNPDSNFWLKGSGIGGGPGFTQDVPVEVKIDNRRAMKQRTHPDRAYEFVYPEQITNYYDVYLGNSANEILIISFTYDEKSSNAKENLNIFDQILSTFRFTP